VFIFERDFVQACAVFIVLRARSGNSRDACHHLVTCGTYKFSVIWKFLILLYKSVTGESWRWRNMRFIYQYRCVCLVWNLTHLLTLAEQILESHFIFCRLFFWFLKQVIHTFPALHRDNFVTSVLNALILTRI
jgi:hypothetical protein